MAKNTPYRPHGSVQTLTYNNTTVGNGQSLMSGYAIDPSKPWNFTFTLSDIFSSITGSGHVEEAGAYFNIERTGVSVGMRSQSSDGDKRFEVAGDYSTHLYGGIAQCGDPIGSLLAMGIQVGTLPAQTVSSGGTYASVDPILFKRPYLSPPMLFFSFLSSTATRYNGRVGITAKEVDNNGFKVLIANDYEAKTITVQWLAVGVINPDKTAEPVAMVTRPVSPMTATTSQNCTVTASSTWSSSYPAWMAFDNNLSTSWASEGGSSTNAWIALQMDVALTQITVKVYARDSQYIHNPTSGKIQGSNNGTSWTDIGSFSGWSTTARSTLLGTVECGNTTAYNRVRVLIQTHGDVNDDSSYVAIGNIRVMGVTAS